MHWSTLAVTFLIRCALALPMSDGQLAARTTYSFNQMVAFGDELSDNGSGSFAHGMTGSPASVYGHNTWTNGLVAVSYLARDLGVPLLDYAFGGCCGGGSFGATLDSAYTKSAAGSPSLVQQIANYTGKSDANIKKTMQFIWIGENDLSEHTDAFWLGDPKNKAFADNVSQRIAASVKTLLNKGAPHVFVANIYPKHLAPVTSKYLCGTNEACVKTFGQIIKQANTEIKQKLQPFGKKVIYYDAFAFTTKLINNAKSHGFTKPLTAFCDGDGDANWKDCMEEGHGGEYFWMNYVQPTTRVHKLTAADMAATVKAHFT